MGDPGRAEANEAKGEEKEKGEKEDLHLGDRRGGGGEGVGWGRGGGGKKGVGCLGNVGGSCWWMPVNKRWKKKTTKSGDGKTTSVRAVLFPTYCEAEEGGAKRTSWR